jgi:hypothetical protein
VEAARRASLVNTNIPATGIITGRHDAEPFLSPLLKYGRLRPRGFRPSNGVAIPLVVSSEEAAQFWDLPQESRALGHPTS